MADIKFQRTVGSLTVEDLGIEIEVIGEGIPIRPIRVHHEVDEPTGEHITVLFDIDDVEWNVLALPSDTLFKVIES